MKNMEQLLSVWIENQNQHNVPINVVLIQEKACTLFRTSSGSRARALTFKASCWWFTSFKARHSLRSLEVSSEAPGSAVEEACKYLVLLHRVIQEGGYMAQQVFSMDETGLFWKRLPDRTFLSMEDKSAPEVQSSPRSAAAAGWQCGW